MNDAINWDHHDQKARFTASKSRTSPSTSSNALEFASVLHSLQSLWAAVVEVVENHQLIPLLQQNKSGVAPDEASASSD
jgi:ribonuclease HI